MSEVIIKISRSTKNASLKIAEDYKFDKFANLPISKPRNSGKISLSKLNKQRIESKQTLFTEKFVISNTNQPLQISLDKINEPTLSVEDAKIEIQSAYDKGFSDGREATEINTQNEIQKYAEWLKRIDNVTQEIRQDYSKQINTLKEMILPTSVMLAKYIINEELKQNPEIILKQVKKAVEIVEEDTIFKIQCNPNDIAILEENGNLLVNASARESKIELIADSKISQGGCILQTSAGIIDATIESQLKRVLESIQAD